MFKRTIASAFILVQFAGGVHAQTDITTIFEHKAWAVTHQYSPRLDEQLCSADTWNDKMGGLFSIGLRHDGSLAMSISTSKPLWENSFTDDLVVAIDYNNWTLHNAKFDVINNNSRVRFYFQPGSDLRSFISQLYDGRVVALKDSQGEKNLVTWSLAGSGAALLKLSECGDRIRSNSNRTQPSGYGKSSGYN